MVRAASSKRGAYPLFARRGCVPRRWYQDTPGMAAKRAAPGTIEGNLGAYCVINGASTEVPVHCDSSRWFRRPGPWLTRSRA